jgi:hypothetical protein
MAEERRFGADAAVGWLSEKRENERTTSMCGLLVFACWLLALSLATLDFLLLGKTMMIIRSRLEFFVGRLTD